MRGRLLTVQQMQVMESYPGQVGLEGTLRGTEEIDPHLAQARLVVIGIDKGACAASRHPPSCAPAGKNPRSEGHYAHRIAAEPRVGPSDGG